MRNQPDRAPRSTSIAGISFLFVIIGAVSTARAQSAEAEALFDTGDKLMTEGKLAEACESFEASNLTEPRAGTLIRLGECRELSHQIASAWSAYKDALGRVKDPNKRAIATEKVAELEPRMSHLTIAVSGHIDGLVVTRNGKPVDPMVWNRALPIDGGAYAIAASAPGHREWTTTVTVPDERGETSVTVPALEVEPAISVAPPHQPPPPPPPVGPMFTPRRKIAIGVAGASAASVLVGVIFGVSARGKQNDAYALCPDPKTPCAMASEATALTSTGHTRAIIADVAFGGAAVAAIAAGVLWVTGRPDTATPQVSLAPVPHGSALVLTGRF
jgi:hypothetical protein